MGFQFLPAALEIHRQNRLITVLNVPLPEPVHTWASFTVYFAVGSFTNPIFMILRIASFMSLVVLIASCDFGRRQQELLSHQVDSLTNELALSQQAANTLEEVGTLIDSIDRNRNALRTNMLEGTTYDQYIARMEDINAYIKSSEAKIEALEKSTKSSKSVARSYAATIKKLKAEVSSRNEELASLQAQVDKYRNENENLIHTVALQKAEIEDKLSKLSSSKGEIEGLEKSINELLIQSKLDEAEAYFLRAQAVEMAANRTKFAWRKRKETRQEALELYKLAKFYGKEEAQPRIEELEAKI